MPKRGMNVYKRKDGRWEGRYFNGKKRNGRKLYSAVYGRSYTETWQKLIEKLNDIPENTKNVSFEMCADRWLTDTEKRVKLSTYANYRFLLGRHILPFFTGYKMKNLTSEILEEFISEKMACGKLKCDKGLSKKYLKDIVSVVKQIAAYAERHFGIRNKIRYISMPRPDKKEIQTLDSAEKKTLSTYLNESNESMDIGILISLYTGMRIGEVCGLKWEDVDLQNNVINVRRTVQRICDGNGGTFLHIGMPKTNNSYRTIPIPKPLADVLSKRRSNPSNTVITGTSRYSEPQHLRKRFKDVLKTCNISNLCYHGLRHTFASECIRLGFDIKALSEILGHSSATMTLDRYAHTTLETKRMYMERIA